MRPHRTLAIAAALLGALAALTALPRGRVEVATLAREIEREEDHVSALQLAAWIRDGRRGLRVIDLRSQAEFDEYHIPTAEQWSLSRLVAAAPRPGETLVLYSEGGTHAAQGWFLLRARGDRNVFFLREGLYEWMTAVLNPTLPGHPTAAQRAAYDSAAALGRYFGGVPRAAATEDPAFALPAREHSHGAAGEVRRVRRRGC